MTNTLSWVPKPASIKEHDGNRVVLAVDVRVSPQQIEFGEVPDDTEVLLQLQRGGTVHVSADRVGSNVVLHIQHSTQRQPITISDFFTVRIDRGSGRPVITAGRKRLIVEADSTQFELHTGSRPVKVKSSGNCTVSGAGSVIEAELDGQLHLQCPLAPNASISGQGHLFVHGGLTNSTVAIDGPLSVEGAVQESQLSATRLNVTGSVSDSEAEVSGPVHIERSLVASTLTTTGDEGWVHVGGDRGESPFDLDDLPLDEEPEWWPERVTKEPRHGQITDSTVAASGAITCKEVVSSEVTTQGQLLVRFGVSGDNSQLLAHGHAFVGADITDGCTIEVGGNFAGVGVLEGASALACDETANVKVVDAQVQAARVRLRGADSGAVEAHKDIRVAGSVAADCPLSLFGSGHLDEPVASDLTWRPAEAARLILAAPVDTLNVDSTDDALVVTGSASIEWLRLDGKLQLEWSAGQGSSGIRHLDAHEADAATLTAHFTQELVVGEVSPPKRGTLQVDVVDGKDTSGRLRLENLRPGAYDLTAIGQVPLHVRCGGDEDETVSSEETTIHVRAETHLVISGEVTTLISHGNPLLVVDDDGAVRDLRGEWQLGSVSGRVYGGSYTDRSSATPPLITAVHEQTEGKGQVAGIDPTTVRFAQLSEFAKLHIFDPEAEPLMRLGKEIPEDRMDRLQRSEVAHRLAEIVSERASSGSTRSAARWAAARLHHATALTRPERLLRTLHRAVGYSQRPGPAALTWLLTAAALGLLSAAHRLGASKPLWTGEPWQLLWESRWSEALTTLGHAIVQLLLLPARLFRFTADDGGDLLFGSATWHVLAFVAVGLPFLFLVLALRNFLISPVDD